MLASRRLGDPQVVRGGSNGTRPNVGAQHLELPTGGPLADGCRHQALLGIASRGPDAVGVRLTSVNGGLAGT
jgi:hypothetical protein